MPCITLTLYHTISTFNNPVKAWKSFQNIVGKGENADKSIFPFPTMFSTLSKEIIILATFNLSSAHALNLVKSKKLLFGKKLRHYQRECHFFCIIMCIITYPARGQVALKHSPDDSHLL